jgi:hypothetical protein
MMCSKSCWILYDAGKMGTLNQCLGLAEAMGLKPDIYPVTARFPWSYLPAAWWPTPLKGLTAATRPSAPWPDLVIAGGRVSAAPAAAIRKQTSGRTRVIQLLNPRMHPRHFDAVIVPFHDQLTGENVIQTVGAFHRITPQRLAEERQKFLPELSSLHSPLAAILIGGSNKYYRIDQDVMTALTADLKRLMQQEGYSLVVTISRRTDDDCKTYLRQQLHGFPVHIWTGDGPNPYIAYLAVADVIMVTADSISMISEAASTGKPVYIYPLPGSSKKFSRFHTQMIQREHARFFTGTLQPYTTQPLDDTTRALSTLKTLLSV